MLIDILILPPTDLAHAENPCPRYMRHKIESYVGHVRHVSFTSLVTSSKTDIYGVPCANPTSEKFRRKSLLVEFTNQEQMGDLIRDFSQQFPNDKGEAILFDLVVVFG